MHTWWPDVRYAVRSLRNARGFTLIAITTLALGIGANTAVFSIVSAVLLGPLPFERPDRLQTISVTNPARGITGGPFSNAQFEALRERQHSFAGLAAIATDQFNLTGVDRPEELAAARVSASFFDVLGVRPVVGRSFLADEDGPGAANVVVLSDRLWHQLFNRGSQAIGSTVALSGVPFTVVGALGAELPPPYDGVDVWTTKVTEISSLTQEQIRNGAGYLSGVGRLADGVAGPAAAADVAAIARAYAADHPGNTDADPGSRLALAPLDEQSSGGTRPTLLVLMAAVALVLLIACANVANLLLVRAVTRTHEWALRAALGAGRGRLIGAMCAESVTLALAGGALGILFAEGAIRFASATLNGLPRGAAIGVDARVLVFSVVVSVSSGVVFGLVPAWGASRVDLVGALKSGGRGATPHRGRVAGALVVGEVALSLVLLIGSGLLLQSFVRLVRIPVGFRPEGLLTMRLSLPAAKYANPVALDAFFERLLQRVDALPGVASAAASLALPPSG